MALDQREPDYGAAAAPQNIGGLVADRHQQARRVVGVNLDRDVRGRAIEVAARDARGS